ncbi:MAG: VCBS repeat-containing protein [Chitinophagaceae bacterium]
MLLFSCGNKTLLEEVPSTHSGIDFNNQITENDSINPLDMPNVYNGGGAGIADFNNDGLQDIYLTGNLVSNKLYLNEGDFKFKDVTDAAGVTGEGRWSRGIAVVDINNDGWMDMYISTTLTKNPDQRQNLLYINKGAGKDGVPHFEERAAEYGLNDTTHSTMAAFFDYDNDNDLDMYLTVNEIMQDNNPGQFRTIIKDGSFPSTGRLYRNDWNDSLKHAVFSDVSKVAGITIEGYGHGCTITDINKDGWKDIYVTNDFISNNILYINNQDGTFTDKSTSYFKHAAANAMGQDVVDINNDGLADVIELDMNPEDNYRKKMMLNGNSYRTYQSSDEFGYAYQYVRNTLQLNQGPRVNQNDSIGDPVFSDIGFYSGIAETDWSWTPLVIDFDNDGWRDIIVTNGYPRDITDHDFMAFQVTANNLLSHEEILTRAPQIKLHNYAFKNNGDLTFSNVSKDWGLMLPTFSNGAAFADFDNDGDLDMIINNINDKALLYRNRSGDAKKNNNHFLQINFKGDSLNKNGLGAWVELHYDNGKQQVYENSPYRGYLSSNQNIAHFGLGNNQLIDTVLIKWPGGKMQLLQNVKASQVLTVNEVDANMSYSFADNGLASSALFREITDSVNIHYRQEEFDYIDFNVQRLLPHKFSEYGPALASADIDRNGFDDIIIGGSAFYSAQLFFQNAEGRFIQKSLLPDEEVKKKKGDDLGVLLFDADNDNDPDLFIAGGGYEYESNDPAYRDRFYINDGKGNFTLDSTAIPANFTSKFCVRAADYNKDGKTDLFISGRVNPRRYPQPVSSFIYRNDSRDGQIKFTDVTAEVAGSLINIGMVCDGVWTDFDNDGWPDLVLAGEWMPVTFLKNNKGVFSNSSSTTGISNQSGLWNSLAPGDFDNDGDIDFIIGNMGLNSFYRASEKYPVRLYGKDFDSNGVYDMIPSLYLPDKDGKMKEFPAQNRDDLLEQIIYKRKIYATHQPYALAGMKELLTAQDLKGALILEGNNFRNSFIRNEGNGKFTMIPLPAAAQFSTINGMVVEDFDGDGNLDVIINGNDFGTEVSVGRYDAFNGLFLKGDGKGSFIPLSILQSGIFIPGNGKSLVKLRSANGKCLLAAGQNRGAMKIFELKKQVSSIPFQPNDAAAVITFKNGIKRKQEAYFGSSFLSQSGRFINGDANLESIEIFDNNGIKRKVEIK